MAKKKKNKPVKDLGHVAKLERSLATHELANVRKVSLINALEKKLENLAQKTHLDEVRKEIKKISKHEDLIFETNKYIHEVLNELSRLKDSHSIIREKIRNQEEKIKNDFEEKITTIKEELKTETNPNLRNELIVIKDRLSQLEYQNKLLIRYIKIMEEKHERHSQYLKNSL